MLDSMVNVLRSAWQEFVAGAQIFLPHLLVTLSLVAAGWLVAWLVSSLLRLLLIWGRFDHLGDRPGPAATLKKLTVQNPSDLLASALFWLIWAGFIISGLEALGFEGMQGIVADFFAFLPRLGIGIIILIVGLIAANFAWRATLLAAVNSHLPSARLLSAAVRGLIVVLAVAMALEQIGVAKTMMMTAFAIAFGAVMLGVGIAIGIGGGPIARRLLEHQFPDSPAETEPPPDARSHL